MRLLRMRSDLWRFQASALDALDKEGYDVPVCVTDVGQALPGFSIATLLLSLIDPIPTSAWRTFRKWTAANRLLLSFHYYAPPTACTFTSASSRARVFGQLLGGSISGVPTFLSEFVETEPQDVADDIEHSIRLGTSAVAYWQFVSAKKTHKLEVNGAEMTFHKQPDGWAAYPEGFTPPAPKEDGSLPAYAVCDTLEEFAVYQQQVERGEFWGAAITQFGGAEVKHSVLHALVSYYRPCKPLSLHGAADVLASLAEERKERRRKANARVKNVFRSVRAAKAAAAKSL